MNIYCTNFIVASALLLTSACGSDGALITNPVETESLDISGNWINSCKELPDLSGISLATVSYSNSRINLSDGTITALPVLFEDSDCTTLASFPYQYTGFSEGTYSLATAFTTETGLSAYPITIQVLDSDEVIENIVTISDGVLYFGFDLIEGQEEGATTPQTFDLANGYQRL